MNKFYTLALAALCTVGASAADKSLKSFTISQIPVAEKIGNVVEDSPLQISNKTFSPLAASFETVAEIEGEYELDFTALVEGLASPIPCTITYDTSSKLIKNRVIISFDGWQIYGTVTLGDNATLTIKNNQVVGQTENNEDIYFYLKDVDATTGKIADGVGSASSTIGTISGRTITFPELDVWFIAVPELENTEGIYFGSYNNVIDEPSEPIEWAEFGTGVFVDGWVVSANEVEPTNYPWLVPVMRAVGNENLFRIVNPYNPEDGSGWPFNNKYGDGEIVFDITDPNCVLVMPGYFSGVTNGGSKLYFFNLEGYAYVTQGFPTEAITESLNEIGQSVSTYSNKVAHFENCRFDIMKHPTSAYVWSGSDNQNLTSLMHGSLNFDRDPAGIQGIVADSETETNAPVEYYNLQGMRIQNPAAGQIVIRRQGTQAQKVMVR